MVADARARRSSTDFDGITAFGDLIHVARDEDRAAGDAAASRRLLIAAPFYRNETLVGPLAQSLLRCADEICELGGEIVLFNDSPDYPPLAAALEEAAETLSDVALTRVQTNPQNLGFVRTMNQAIAEAAARRFDLLLLNSDTVVFPGAIREMARIATTDPMIAFVNPRSNNATLATLPAGERFRDLPPEAAYAAWRNTAKSLPPVTYAPTAVGFCLLCRWKVLAEFGGFDEIYGAGYHEENDLVMRANRCGYRAVLANHAFVWHAGEASFGKLEQTKAARDKRNEAILFSRYPEYPALVHDFFESPEHHAERLLATLIPDADGRIDVAFDLSAFGAYHNGTFAAGRQLLAAAAKQWGARFNLFAICSREAYRFHDYAALGIKRRNPDGRTRYAAIFRIGQPYGIGELDRLIMQAAVIGIYMLDTISVDCGELSSPRLFNLWQFTLEHADLIATTSQLSTDQLARRFWTGDAIRIRAMHSVDLDDYRLSSSVTAQHDDLAASGAPDQPYLLVVGNKFAHKYVIETANALAQAYPDQSIVALGVVAADEGAGPPAANRPKLIDAPNIFAVPVGKLSQGEMTALYRRARAVVFPTHYEGFGFPLLDALAVETPIFARRNAALEEVWRLQGSSPNVRFFDLTRELVTLAAEEISWIDDAARPAPGCDASQSAKDILDGLEQALERVSYSRITERIRAVQFINDIANDEAARRSQIVVREARGLAKRLAATQEEAASLRLHASATEQTLGGRALRWMRRLLLRHPQLFRPMHRSLYTILRNLKPLPPPPEPTRDPTKSLIEQSDLFDAAWYLSNYEDVAWVGADPLTHFTTQALEERRDPGPEFSTVFYLEQRPDVFDTGMNPLEHYLTIGRDEGAKPRPDYKLSTKPRSRPQSV